MKQNLLYNMLADVWGDLRDPNLLWQILTLATCLAAGWWLARLLKERFTSSDSRSSVVRLGVRSFGRVLWPLIALVLVSVATAVLSYFQPVSLLRLAIPLIASFALIRLVFYVLRRAFARGGKAGAFLLLSETVIATLVWACVALYITGLWPDVISYLDKTVLPIGRHKVSLLTIVQATASVLVTLMFALWAGAMLEERLMRIDSIHSSLRAVMARMGRALFILVAVLLSLSLVGIDLTVLSVFGGALGVGLGLGLQKIVSSYFSGFVILLERSLAIGDIVGVDKYYGQVTHINTRYTIIRSMDGLETVVPNEMFVAGPVQNYSLTDRTLRLSTQLTVAYDTDLDQLLPLIEKNVASIPRILSSPAPRAFLMRFGADGLEIDVGFWISDPENGRSNVVSEVNQLIWKQLKAHHVNVPYAQREVRLVDAREYADTKPAIKHPAKAS